MMINADYCFVGKYLPDKSTLTICEIFKCEFGIFPIYISAYVVFVLIFGYDTGRFEICVDEVSYHSFAKLP